MAESFSNKIVRAAGIVSTTDAGASIGAGSSAITSIQTADSVSYTHLTLPTKA